MANREQLEALVDESADALFALSLAGIVIAWNRGAELLFGYTADEAIGHSTVDLIVAPDDRPNAERELADVAQLRRATFEVVRRRKTGEPVHVRVAIRHVATAAEPFFVAAATDLSQLRAREADAALVRNLVEAAPDAIGIHPVDAQTEPLFGRRLEQKVHEAKRLKGEFLANMSHELRTPLTAIIGFTELMHRGKAGPLEPDQHEYLGDILSSAKHLLQLINDVVDLAKVESGKMELRPAAVDLALLVGEVADVLRGLATVKRQLVMTAIDPAVARVRVDPARVKQVLYNLMSNAIKFTPNGGTIEVHARSDAAPEMFRLEVRDTGIGIAPEDMARLFVEFQQLDHGATHHHGSGLGTGLGLALTKQIVEAHGGRVEVESRLGVGSTFAAVLPRAPGEPLSS